MDWIAVSAVSGAVVATGTVSVFLFRHIRPRLIGVRQFIEHLVGVPANPVTGQARIPGLFERLDQQDARLEERLDRQDDTLAAQDKSLARQDAVLETIRHEVEFNNGSSVKDAIRRIETRLAEHLKEPE